MPSKKITDLTELTAPATGDLVEIVDIDAALADRNKKIKGENLSKVIDQHNLKNFIPKQITLRLGGNAYVDTDLLGVVMDQAGTFVSARAYAATAPTGAALQIDINKNGVSVLSSVLEIAAAANSGTTTGFSTTTFSAGDRITIDIDQVGSSVAGGDPLYITISFK